MGPDFGPKNPNFNFLRKTGLFRTGLSPNSIPGLQLLKCLGTLWEQGNPKLWGFFGENPRKPQNFGDGDGVATLKMFRDTLGTGKPQTLGFFGEKSQKTPKFRSGDGGKNLGDFYHTNIYYLRDQNKNLKKCTINVKI